MSTSVQLEPVMERRYGGVGRCKCSFWFAVAHDILGVFIMMVGVFGGLVIHDLFIYAGAIIIFLSLIWWVFWYSGNIDVPPEELEDDVGLVKLKSRGLSRAVRQVSDRFTSRIRNSFRKTNRSIREGPVGNNRPSNMGTGVSLSTIYDSTIASSSKELVRETLSI
ncbi:transmembrane protein 238-like [Micropterus salmoides]|uniref:transmembrane protein 238-like n=1 Tax=Micropterus salmoides TaxID=27706 RepID=UPI0018EA3C40|nr:transmembrane protein 238-like [Micropterus salmoides]